MSFEARLKAIFNKKENLLFKASEAFFHTDFLRTNIPAVDCSLGGGFGRGRIAELYGNYSSGKTLVLYYALIQNTREGGESILLESEGAFDQNFYRKLGGDPDKLILIPVERCEEVFDYIVAICKTQTAEIKEALAKRQTPMVRKTVIGWDSLAATGTKHLQETGMDKVDMSKAKVIAQGSALIPSLVKECNVTVISTNQTRENINSKDSATATPGGKSWPFACSQRVELRFHGGTKGSLLLEVPKSGKDADDPTGREEIGRMISCYVTKNKLAAPFARFKLPIYTMSGFEHPEFDGRKTQVGIDLDEALFHFFLTGRCYLDENQSRVLIQAGSRYKLNPLIDPDQVSFFQKDWPSIIESLPSLRTMPYDLIASSCSNPPIVPEDIPADAIRSGEAS